jgi:long-chain fatty acid transport protein
MKKFILLASVLFVTALSLTPALATNGDNLIGIGPISRSMGGVGIAAAQDAISAVFSNPATLAFTPTPDTEFDFAGTLFMPKVKGKIELGGTTYQADSQGTA